MKKFLFIIISVVTLFSLTTACTPNDCYECRFEDNGNNNSNWAEDDDQGESEFFGDDE